MPTAFVADRAFKNAWIWVVFLKTRISVRISVTNRSMIRDCCHHTPPPPSSTSVASCLIWISISGNSSRLMPNIDDHNKE
jgi:hypothetical protein